MMKKIIGSAVLGLMLMAAGTGAQAAPYTLSEAPTSMRLEQFTTAWGGVLTFWRLPTPGTSVFPGGTCTKLIMPTAAEVQASRILAVYLFAKSNSKNVFVQYETSNCTILSFGMDG